MRLTQDTQARERMRRYLAYGCLRVTGGRMPAALALNTAAHASSRGDPGCWSGCEPTGPEAVESRRAFLLTHSRGEQKRQRTRVQQSSYQIQSNIHADNI